MYDVGGCDVDVEFEFGYFDEFEFVVEGFGGSELCGELNGGVVIVL